MLGPPGAKNLPLFSFYLPCFTDDKTKAQRQEVTCLSPHGRSCNLSPSLTPERKGFTPYMLPPSRNPRKDIRIRGHRSW